MLFASLLALGSVGCDKLISSDVAEIPFALPARTYSLDSSTFAVPAGLAGEVPCGAGQLVTDCCVLPVGPAPDCATTPVACEQNENGMNVCTATVTVAQSQVMNLGMEVMQLSGYTGFVNIKIKRISYEVMTNTLDVNLPEIYLYLGPEGAKTSKDADVMAFGTMPAIPAMMQTSGDVILDSNAAGALAHFTSNIKAPFTFIAETTPKVTHSPTGKIDLRVTGTLAISP